MDIKSFVKDLQDRNNSTYYKAITLAETIIKGLYEEDNPQEYKKLRTALADLRCESQVDFDKYPKCKISMFDDNIEDLWCCPECGILIKQNTTCILNAQYNNYITDDEIKKYKPVHKPDKHFCEWLNHILARETPKNIEDVLDRTYDYFTYNNIKQIAPADIRPI